MATAAHMYDAVDLVTNAQVASPLVPCKQAFTLAKS